MSYEWMSLWWKILKYECGYLYKKFSPLGLANFFVYVAGSVVLSYSDTNAFFTGDGSFIPARFSLLKDKQIVAVIAVIIIVTLSIVNKDKKTKTNKELYEVIADNIVPHIDSQLDSLLSKLTRSFGLKGLVRVSIHVPVRTGFLRWRFQMVCRTSNIPKKELKTEFCLDEGVIGYTFMKMESSNHHMEVVDLTNPGAMPKTYKALTQENSNLIKSDLKAVLTAAAFQKGSIAGFISIDTDNDLNISKLRDKSLHSECLDWIIEKNPVVRLFWRMKNNA